MLAMFAKHGRFVSRRGCNLFFSSHSGPKHRYIRMIELGALTSDPKQLKAIESLQRLFDEIMKSTLMTDRNDSITVTQVSRSRDDIECTSADRPTGLLTQSKGLYIYGGPGCGYLF
jgi:predicted ATPase